VPPRFREERREGVAGISRSVMAGEGPLVELTLLPARVVRLVDMFRGRGSTAERVANELAKENCEKSDSLSASMKSGSMSNALVVSFWLDGQQWQLTCMLQSNANGQCSLVSVNSMLNRRLWNRWLQSQKTTKHLALIESLQEKHLERFVKGRDEGVKMR
jgi:hypothetical protein